jgi:hypothetical protein
MAMGGCIMEPVKLVGFGDDETFDRGVQIIAGSDAGLVEGNARITGLIPGKYYTVEEWNGNGEEMGIQFVSSSGRRSANLTGIGRVSTGELSGLTNFHHYKVKSAKPLTGNVSYSYISGGSPAIGVIDSDGVIYIPPPYGDWLVFNPSSALPPPAPISSYDIVSVPVSSAGSTAPIPHSGNIATPALAGTTVDYVFYDRDIYALYVLRVVFKDGGGIPPTPGSDLTITVVPYIHPTDQTFTFTPATETYTHAEALNGDPASLTVTVNTASFDGIDGWYYKGINVSTTNSLAMSSTTIDFTVSGSYEFIFIGTIGSGASAVPYNGTFTVVISPQM